MGLQVSDLKSGSVFAQQAQEPWFTLGAGSGQDSRLQLYYRNSPALAHSKIQTYERVKANQNFKKLQENKNIYKAAVIVKV